MNKKPIISCRDLSVHFPIGGGLFEQKQFVRAVNNVNLSIPQGSFFGLVGESGSGKTTLGRAFLRAVPITHGEINYSDGEKDYDAHPAPLYRENCGCFHRGQAERWKFA